MQTQEKFQWGVIATAIAVFTTFSSNHGNKIGDLRENYVRLEVETKDVREMDVTNIQQNMDKIELSLQRISKNQTSPQLNIEVQKLHDRIIKLEKENATLISNESTRVEDVAKFLFSEHKDQLRGPQGLRGERGVEGPQRELERSLIHDPELSEKQLEAIAQKVINYLKENKKAEISNRVTIRESNVIEFDSSTKKGINISEPLIKIFDKNNKKDRVKLKVRITNLSNEKKLISMVYDIISFIGDGGTTCNRIANSYSGPTMTGVTAHRSYNREQANFTTLESGEFTTVTIKELKCDQNVTASSGELKMYFMLQENNKLIDIRLQIPKVKVSN